MLEMDVDVCKCRSAALVERYEAVLDRDGDVNGKSATTAAASRTPAIISIRGLLAVSNFMLTRLDLDFIDPQQSFSSGLTRALTRGRFHRVQ